MIYLPPLFSSYSFIDAGSPFHTDPALHLCRILALPSEPRREVYGSTRRDDRLFEQTLFSEQPR